MVTGGMSYCFDVAITDTCRVFPTPADKAPKGQKEWPEGKLRILDEVNIGFGNGPLAPRAGFGR